MMYRLRILTLVIFFAAEIPAARAQFLLGLEGGADKNYLLSDVSNLNAFSYQSRYGFLVTVPVIYTFREWLSFQADPGFIQKNYEWMRSGFYTGIFQQTTNSYLQLPLSVKFTSHIKKWEGFINLGGYGAYWISSHISGTTPNILDQPPYSSSVPNVAPSNVFGIYNSYSYNTIYSFDPRKDNRVEWGIFAGLGLAYQWTPKYSLFLQARFYDGLTDQQKNYEYEQIARYNQTITLSLGGLYRLK